MRTVKRHRSYAEHRPFKKLPKGFEGLKTTRALSHRMGLVRQRSTAPELAVRRVASSLRIRFTTRNADLPGSPDLANRTRRFAVFVHGCYWHRHRACTRTTTPKTNRAFWEQKFAQNQARDASAVANLKAQGFRVVVIWECEATEPEIVATRLRIAAARACVRPRVASAI
jgi:DNA mismatch endonuclease (patch repair protein)